MPYRLTPIVPNQIYHVFNRSIAYQPIFLSHRDYIRAIESIDFYSYGKSRLRFSHYNRLQKDQKDNFLKDLKNQGRTSIQILNFCLMPNHFHFLIKELKEKGISSFIGNFQNSYAKYFNTKRKRAGALFQSMFKAVRIENDDQFLHVGRYIHLNPYTAYLLKELNKLKDYPWSSYPHYLGKINYEFIFSNMLDDFFSSKEKLNKFTLDQADYQRKLGEIKHLLLE